MTNLLEAINGKLSSALQQYRVLRVAGNVLKPIETATTIIKDLKDNYSVEEIPIDHLERIIKNTDRLMEESLSLQKEFKEKTLVLNSQIIELREILCKRRPKFLPSSLRVPLS